MGFHSMRRSRLSLLAGACGLALLLAGPGCNGGDKPTPTLQQGGKLGGGGKSKGTGKEQGKGTVKPPPAKDVTPRTFARDFLDALSEGNASPEWVADTLKRQVAPPVLPSDKEQGYDASDLRKWLGNVGRGAAFEITSEASFDGTTAFRGTVKGGQDPGSFSLRVRKEGDAYKVVWFQRSPVTGTVPSEKADAVVLQARETARDFLEALLGDKPNRAEALMATPLREKIGGRPSASDRAKGLTYDRGYLMTKLRTYRRYASYAITKQERVAGKDAAIFRAGLNGDGKGTVTLTVGREEPGGPWRVQGFSEE